MGYIFLGAAQSTRFASVMTLMAEFWWRVLAAAKNMAATIGALNCRSEYVIRAGIAEQNFFG